MSYIDEMCDLDSKDQPEKGYRAGMGQSTSICRFCETNGEILGS